MFSCTQNGPRLDLSGDLKVNEAETIHSQLMPFLKDNQPLELNLAQVDEVDTAGLQLILAFCLSKETSGQIKITGAQPSCTERWRLPGLNASLIASCNKYTGDKPRTMNKTILCIDDSATLRMSVEMTLNKAGYQVRQAVNGQEGLDLLNEMAQEAIRPA